MTENDSSPSPNRDSESDRNVNNDERSGDDEDARRKTRAKVLRFAGLGTELAAYTLTVAGVGYVIDSARGHDKAYATAFGTLIGFTFGMVRFIREVNKHIKD